MQHWTHLLFRMHGGQLSQGWCDIWCPRRTKHQRGINQSEQEGTFQEREGENYQLSKSLNRLLTLENETFHSSNKQAQTTRFNPSIPGGTSHCKQTFQRQIQPLPVSWGYQQQGEAWWWSVYYWTPRHWKGKQLLKQSNIHSVIFQPRSPLKSHHHLTLWDPSGHGSSQEYLICVQSYRAISWFVWHYLKEIKHTEL